MEVLVYAIKVGESFFRMLKEPVSLEEGKKEAYEMIAYSKENIYLLDEDGEVIAYSKWYGVKPSENDEVLYQFGDFGFYTNWKEDFKG